MRACVRGGGQVIAVGLNAVREIFSRVPALLREPDMDDFIQARLGANFTLGWVYGYE